jgi:hypothetical protein
MRQLRSVIVSMCVGVVLASMPQPVRGEPVQDSDTRIVNIINFIRGVEPREAVDLYEPVAQQVRLVKKHDLPATFLIQYDALLQDRYVDLLKNELTDKHEVGLWLEIVQPLVEKAGLQWRGRFPWDWHSDVGFTVGYLPEQRKKLVDVAMEDFRARFGQYPESVGSWFIDAVTLEYLASKYSIVASCNCKDQIGTDGYTIWGGYWNQGYYPSRLNMLCPAQDPSRQISVPVFRMLGSDPIHQYDHDLGTHAQSVVSLEPVYPKAGGNPEWVRWFFDVNFSKPYLSFAYTQVGQENSFSWPKMKDGLTDQIQLVAEMVARDELEVMTLADTGRWFRERFPQTPASAVVALEDWSDEQRQSVWYNTPYYRANLIWNNSTLRFRDIHLFDDSYRERYLTTREDTLAARFDNLPVLDGFSWSRPDDLAGVYLVKMLEDGSTEPLPVSEMIVDKHGKDGLKVVLPHQPRGEITITLSPAELQVTASDLETPWALELRWSKGTKPPIERVAPDAIYYRHAGFPYILRASQGQIRRAENAAIVSPINNRIELDMNCTDAP